MHSISEKKIPKMKPNKDKFEKLFTQAHINQRKNNCYNLEYVKNQESQREDGKADLDSNISKEGFGNC